MLQDSSYRKLPDHAYALIETRSALSPTLLAWNAELAEELGLDAMAGTDADRARIFSGGAPPSSSPR